MSRESFDRLRLPLGLGLVLMLLVGYVFLQRTQAESTAPSPTASVVVGAAGGGVVTPPPASTAPATPSLAPTPVPTAVPTAAPTAAPTPAPTPPPAFTAEVMACRRIDGAECIDELDRLRDDDETFVALMLFDDADAGDVLNAILDGPSGPIDGGQYTLQGSGRGYYYTTFVVSGLPGGEYTLTALRNGAPVARTELRKADDDD